MHQHARFSATTYSDLKVYDLRTVKVRSLTHNARVSGPDLSLEERRVAAVQIALPTTQMATVNLEYVSATLFYDWGTAGIKDLASTS